QEQGDQEPDRREQQEQLSLGELAERPVEQAGRARVGVLDAGGGYHDQQEEGEQQEKYGHVDASLRPSRHWGHVRLLAPPQLPVPNWASSCPDRPMRPAAGERRPAHGRPPLAPRPAGAWPPPPPRAGPSALLRPSRAPPWRAGAVPGPLKGKVGRGVGVGRDREGVDRPG